MRSVDCSINSDHILHDTHLSPLTNYPMSFYQQRYINVLGCIALASVTHSAWLRHNLLNASSSKNFRPFSCTSTYSTLFFFFWLYTRKVYAICIYTWLNLRTCLGRKHSHQEIHSFTSCILLLCEDVLLVHFDRVSSIWK